MAVSTPKVVGIVALALAGAFLLGYVPGWFSARDAQAEQTRLAQKLELASLQVQLGMMSNEANRDNYGLAAALAKTFFDGVQSAVPHVAEQAVAQTLQTVLARRDEITSDLAKASPAVKGKIAQLYADLYPLTLTPRVARPAGTP